MTVDATEAGSVDSFALDPLALAAAEDFGLLAALHDREPDARALAALREAPAQRWFGLQLPSEATDALDAALAALPDPVDQVALDNLAADFVEIYLVTGYEAAPTESYWRDDENLVCQDAMFDVRDWMAHYGLKAENWRKRSEDHLVMELQFLAHLCGLGTEIGLRDAARFLDRHLMLWIGDFAERIEARAREPWYRALAVVTAAYCETLRTVLEDTLQEPRWTPPEVETVEPSDFCKLKEAVKYVPGAAPSW